MRREVPASARMRRYFRRVVIARYNDPDKGHSRGSFEPLFRVSGVPDLGREYGAEMARQQDVMILRYVRAKHASRLNLYSLILLWLGRDWSAEEEGPAPGPLSLMQRNRLWDQCSGPVIPWGEIAAEGEWEDPPPPMLGEVREKDLLLDIENRLRLHDISEEESIIWQAPPEVRWVKEMVRYTWYPSRVGKTRIKEHELAGWAVVVKGSNRYRVGGRNVYRCRDWWTPKEEVGMDRIASEPGWVWVPSIRPNCPSILAAEKIELEGVRNERNA